MSRLSTSGGFSVILASNEHTHKFSDLQVRLLRKSKPVRGYLRLGLAAETNICCLNQIGFRGLEVVIRLM